MQTNIQYQQELRARLIRERVNMLYNQILQNERFFSPKQHPQTLRLMEVYKEFCSDLDLMSELAMVDSLDMTIICDRFLMKRYGVGLKASFNEPPCWQDLRDFLWLLAANSMPVEAVEKILTYSYDHKILITPRLGFPLLTQLDKRLVKRVLVDRIDTHIAVIAEEHLINVQLHPLVMES